MAQTPISLDFIITVATPFDKSVVADQVVQGCLIHIGDRTLVPDLILLDMANFNIILVID